MCIELKNVSKSYGKKNQISVIKDFNRTFEDKKLYLIKGASGKGKTTILSIIGLLDAPTNGAIYLDGERVDNLSAQELCRIRREKYAFVFQDFGLLENLSVYENIMLPMQENKDNIDEAKCDAVLEKLNMLHRKNHKVSELSGGEKQRVSFARAMLKESKIFICDEPISSIDEENTEIILEILKELRKEKLVLVSCHTTDIDSLCDEMIRM